MQLKKKIRLFLIVSPLTLLAAIASLMIIVLTFKVLGIERAANSSQSFIRDHFSPVMIFLVINFIGPVLEELGFRLHLKFSPFNFAVSLGILSYFIIGSWMGKSYFFPDQTMPYRIISALLFSGIIFYMTNFKPVEQTLSKVWEKYSKTIFTLTAVGFGLFHLQNFTLSAYPVYIYPVLILPQLVYGFSYGYLRVKLGIFWCIALHCAINMI